MRTSLCKVSSIISSHFLKTLLMFAFLLAGWFSMPARGAVATIAPHYITTDTTWTAAGSPWLIESFVIVNPGVTLTIEPGVEVNGNYANGTNYLFEVDGTLVAQGTFEHPILFSNTLGNSQWSGININGTAGNINQGSVLEYITLDGGGQVGSGAGGNLILKYSQVDVHHGLFKNSPGDGILGDDATAGGVANISDSAFMGNAGYAINFENGSVNPVLSNLVASGNGASLPYGGDLVVINDATLHGAHTWENMGLPYLILGTNVGPDGVLTIDTGVEVLAQPGNDNLDVQGKLIAVGTASQPIQFNSADPDLGWSGIAIEGTDLQPSMGNQLSYVLITKGGFGGNCNLYVTNGDVTVTDSQFDSSQDSGICLDQGSTLHMAASFLTNNQEYAMDVIDANAFFDLDSLTASGNLSDTIGVEGGTLYGSHIWPKSGIDTYDLYYGAVTIAPTGTLLIEPGVTVRFGETRDITVKGVLNAIGTSNEPILFTGETSTPGFWMGINFVGTAEQFAVGMLGYTTIEYGGYGGSAMVYIENAEVWFKNCILRYCANDAIEIQPGKALAFPLAVAQAVQINWSELYGIGGYAINNGSTQNIPALYNWWGAASGPSADDNPDGTGSALNGLVLYRPYIAGPDGSFIYLPVVNRP